MPLNHIFRKCIEAYKFTKSKEKINHHEAICKKCKRTGESDTNNKNIQPGYRNGIWHRKIYLAHSEKWEKTYKEIKKASEYLEKMKITNIWEYWKRDTIKEAERKEKNKSTADKQTKNSWNLIKGISTEAIFFVTYSRPFLKWTLEEFTQMDQSTKKLMTRPKAFEGWHRYTICVKKIWKRTHQHWELRGCIVTRRTLKQAKKGKL